MRKSFSARKYGKDDEWQIVIVGMSSEEKNMIKHYLEQVICGTDETEENINLLKPKVKNKDWEE